MKYVHPIKYEGISENSHIQYRTKQKVERICLACEKFMGKQHDFEECGYKPFLIKCNACPDGEVFPDNLTINNPLKFESED